MIHRKTYRRRPKDILVLALKSLFPTDELLCTESTFRNIRERVEEFKALHPDRIIRSFPAGGLQKIKRIA